MHTSNAHTRKDAVWVCMNVHDCLETRAFFKYGFYFLVLKHVTKQLEGYDDLV